MSSFFELKFELDGGEVARILGLIAPVDGRIVQLLGSWVSRMGVIGEVGKLSVGVDLKEEGERAVPEDGDVGFGLVMIGRLFLFTPLKLLIVVVLPELSTIRMPPEALILLLLVMLRFDINDMSVDDEGDKVARLLLPAALGLSQDPEGKGRTVVSGM